MRFFTGFGVRKFNHNKVKGQHWVDSVIYKSEVTPLASQLQGEVWIGAYIGNWDAKGHRLSLKLKYYPDDERRVNKAMPLFNTVNYLEQAGQAYPVFFLNDSLRVRFTLKEPAKTHAYSISPPDTAVGGTEMNSIKSPTPFIWMARK